LTRGFGRMGVLVRVLVLLAAAWFTVGLGAARAVGQPDGATADRLAALEKSSAAQGAAIAAAQTAGDNAWMLTSSALVLLMSGPGLALFYGGLVRKKNVLGTMMQTFAMMAVITVLWALVTYSLAFGEGNAFIGGLHNVFLHGVGLAPDP
jgi:Amt family ammonium transporter